MQQIESGRADCEYFSVVTVRIDTTQAEVRASGELDMFSAELLGTVLAAHREAGRLFISLDIDELTFIDGHGLRALQGSSEALLSSAGMLTVTGIGERVQRLMDLAGMDGTLSRHAHQSGERISARYQ